MMRVMLVWLLVLVALPFGGGPIQRLVAAEVCASACPCEVAESAQSVEDADCEDEDCEDCEDEDCDDCDDCDGCCGARTIALVDFHRLASRALLARSTADPPAPEAAGRRQIIDVFRPPQA